MAFTTLIDPADLRHHLSDPLWAVVDCRFSLQDPDAGRRAYHAAHIPHAVYAHLDEDLSGPIRPGNTGRHPLPDIDDFARTLTRWGIDERVQVVAYDDHGGAFAARLWWMLKWLGHEAVAVLDGGWQRWREGEYPVRGGTVDRLPRQFLPAPRPELIASADDVRASLEQPGIHLLDARAADRFRGENETLDPVAGHIPGARSMPFSDNLNEHGRFLEPEALQARFEPVAGQEPERVICYCGSGVTAAHHALAMAHAGIGLPRVYPGSWSEWITNPDRPVATGSE